MSEKKDIDWDTLHPIEKKLLQGLAHHSDLSVLEVTKALKWLVRKWT